MRLVDTKTVGDVVAILAYEPVRDVEPSVGPPTRLARGDVSMRAAEGAAQTTNLEAGWLNT
jgi:hypothetical protein